PVANPELAALYQRADALYGATGMNQAECNRRYNDILAAFNGIVNGYVARGILSSPDEETAVGAVLEVKTDDAKEIEKLREQLNGLVTTRQASLDLLGASGGEYARRRG